MLNPFSNVDSPKSSISLQQKIGSQIIKKKRGRTAKPNMVKKLVKVDVVLYQQLKEKADKDHTTIAALLAKGMKWILESN